MTDVTEITPRQKIFLVSILRECRCEYSFDRTEIYMISKLHGSVCMYLPGSQKILFQKHILIMMQVEMKDFQKWSELVNNIFYEMYGLQAKLIIDPYITFYGLKKG